MIGRREFITLLGGAAALPIAARAQPPERMRRVSVMAGAQERSDTRDRLTVFRQALEQAGWSDGRNVRFDVRFAEGNPAKMREHARELVALAPDVLLVGGSAPLGQVLEVTRSIPIVFVNVVDPVGGGYVETLARPGGNATGFMPFEYGLSGKWLELLKEAAPGITRTAVLRDPLLAAGIGQFAIIQAAAASVGVQISLINLRDAAEVERGITNFGRAGAGGMIVTSSALSAFHRDLIIALAARHKLPVIYPNRPFAAVGGLMSYGPDVLDQYRRAAGYIDRILKGEKPADLPVQSPTKYDLVINLKAAKALGLDVPPSLLARADEVIE
jgi:putative tryptophan/tyrosine transport system substrate-binding protein